MLFQNIAILTCLLVVPLTVHTEISQRQNGAMNGEWRNQNDIEPTIVFFSEYVNGAENNEKIIGLKHFEQFLGDLEKKIAEWTKSFRDTVVDKPNPRQRRQAGPSDSLEPPRRINDWIVVQDLIEGAKYVRKQVSDFIDRATRFITGDQSFARQGTFTGPYVPIVKELREYLVLLQKRLTAWSTEVERIFNRGTTEIPMLLAKKWPSSRLAHLIRPSERPNKWHSIN